MFLKLGWKGFDHITTTTTPVTDLLLTSGLFIVPFFFLFFFFYSHLSVVPPSHLPGRIRKQTSVQHIAPSNHSHRSDPSVRQSEVHELQQDNEFTSRTRSNTGLPVEQMWLRLDFPTAAPELISLWMVSAGDNQTAPFSKGGPGFRRAEIQIRASRKKTKKTHSIVLILLLISVIQNGSTFI